MIIETIVWILFTIFIVWLSAMKTKHFMREKGFKKATKDFYKIQSKPTINKTIEEKMSYVRQKTETGQDIMTVVISIIIFIMGFITLVYSKVLNLSQGLVAAFIFALVFSFVFAKLQFTKHIMEYKFIDAFIGYLYAATFMVYVKFVEHIPIILLLVLSIGIMILINNKINKWVGNEIIKR